MTSEKKTIGDLINEGKITLETVVLGELQFLASDEVIASHHHDVWDKTGLLRRANVDQGVAWSDGTYTHLELCYSTPEAAEKARSA